MSCGDSLLDLDFDGPYQLSDHLIIDASLYSPRAVLATSPNPEKPNLQRDSSSSQSGIWNEFSVPVNALNSSNSGLDLPAMLSEENNTKSSEVPNKKGRGRPKKVKSDAENLNQAELAVARAGDADRKSRRRESNRRAARKLRDRRKSEAEERSKEHQRTLEENVSLRIRNAALQEELDSLKQKLSIHENVCGLILPSESEQRSASGNTLTASVTTPPAIQPTQPSSSANQPVDIQPAGMVIQLAGTLMQPAGTVIQPVGTVTQPAGTVTQPAGTVIQPAGTVTQPAGTVTQLPILVSQDNIVGAQPSNILCQLPSMATQLQNAAIQLQSSGMQLDSSAPDATVPLVVDLDLPTGPSLSTQDQATDPESSENVLNDLDEDQILRNNLPQLDWSFLGNM